MKHFRFRDAAHTKPAGFCKSCHAKFMRETRPKHSELTDEQRKKSNCRAYANTYQRRGKLIPKPCGVCSTPNVEKHHDNYDQPLNVKWFCRDHHLANHRIFS